MDNQNKPNKILISIWADPSNYLNLLFLINFLIKNNKKVILVCKKIEKKSDFYYFVKKNYKLKVIEIKETGKYGYIKFFLNKIKLIKKLKFETVISINFISLFFSYFISFSSIKWIYYNFDFNNDKKFNFNNFLEKKIIQKVNYIFIPSNSRLRLYKKIFNRKKNIYPVYNSFSINFDIKNRSYLPIELKNKNFFIRLGSFYKHHGLENLALATKFWKTNTYLVMAGKSYDGYFQILKKFKKENNLTNLLLYENVSYKFWFGLLQKGIAGFALYDPINVSHNLMGGTSQKLNNYIFAGIPSFVTNNKDFEIFNNKYKTSILVSNNSIKEINNGVNKILKNKKLYSTIKKKNNLAFKKEFNFEKQISIVKNIILNDNL